MTPRRFVFNPPTASIFKSKGSTYFLTANEPAIVLEELPDPAGLHTRHEVQRAALGERALPPGGEASPLFGDDLLAACREYIVRRVWVDDLYEQEQPGEQGAPLGNAPPRALDEPPLATERLLATLAGFAEPASAEGAERLYLFNVIVALEWIPTPRRLRRLQWAFRRASDYLYDVTNGGMAFGQVIFAGPDWLHCADIQMLASNRYLPRSWVSALIEPHKYTPIRLGRGLWVRDRRIVVDWDEPEGYRSIVHEWAHYALGLKDEYMHAQTVFGDGSGRLRKRPRRDDDRAMTIVDVDRHVKSESIMATAQGNSELANPLPVRGGDNLREVIGARYKGLTARLSRPWSGPGSLPLPLPYFRLAGSLGSAFAQPQERTFAIPFGFESLAAGQGAAEQPRVMITNDTLPTGRWEVFLARFADAQPTRLCYQGEVDARSPERGFTLLGAAPEDSVLLIRSDPGAYEVWERPLADVDELAEERLVEQQWLALKEQLGAAQAAEQGAETPASDAADAVAALFADAGWVRRAGQGPSAPGAVLPQSIPGSNDKTKARVRLRGGDPSYVFTLDGRPAQPVADTAETYDLPSLDGYVLTIGSAASDGARPGLLIGDFSQGGPPRSAPSMVSDPLAAGAASGEALILCDVAADTAELDTIKYRVITASLRGVSLPAGYQAQSPVFSIASNLRLLERFRPSLLIVNTAGDGETSDDLRICRFDGPNRLVPLPTFIAPGGDYGIAPLLVSTGGALISGGADPALEAEGEYLERFVLARVPDPALDGRGGNVQAA